MITNERITAYINSLEKDTPTYLEDLEMIALQSDVPIIRKEMQSFLKTLLTMNKPKRILEVGTAIGFSALLMSEYIDADAKIVTIEKYEKRIPIAKENFKKYGKEEQITLLEGDAIEILQTLQEPFDFIFMDAAKGQYIHFLPFVLKLLNTGGVLLSDNVLQNGDIIESKYAVTRRDRTIHKRMRDYLFTIKNNEFLQTTILPFGDGVAVSVKKG